MKNLPSTVSLTLILCFIVVVFPTVAQDRSSEPQLTPQTFTYKRVGDLEIKLDVHRAPDDKLRPLLVWIHGGGLINGGRQGVSGPLKKLFLDEGYAVVSLDYRLAPESTLPDIFEDLRDAFAWLRDNAETEFRGDPSRIVVSGGSAGGFLTHATGYIIEPRPAALVSFWGYGEILGDWASAPSPYERHARSELSDADLQAILAGPPVANSKDRTVADGGAFYQHARRTGNWPAYLRGKDPKTEPETFPPYMPLANITPGYPPTLMIHGTADTDVPHAQSALLAAELKKHNIPHQLISVKNGEHGLKDADPKDIEAAYAAVMPFVREHAGTE